MEENHNLEEYKNAQRKDPSAMVRRGPDRRVSDERRNDNRESNMSRRSVRSWIKSLLKPRLGVDRRKGVDRRQARQRLEQLDPKSLVTADELKHLLGN